MIANRRYVLYSWVVLVYNVGVILWGAYVRATSSGAGCGNHWPLCNGVVIPRTLRIETMVEFTHRLTSGLALVFIFGLLVWTLRAFPRGHRLRLGAGLSTFFIITEALVGAGLVKFEWVAQDASIGRVITIAIHLINTFLLLACLSLTSWWASGGEIASIRQRGLLAWGLGIGMAGVLILGISGAITALGDTLFPAGSLVEGFRQDFSPTSHFLIQLRIWHPLIAIVTGLYLVFLAVVLGMIYPGRWVKVTSSCLVALFLLQLVAGIANIYLLVPVWMQMIHLFLADAIWITFVLLAGSSLAAHSDQVVAVREGASRFVGG